MPAPHEDSARPLSAAPARAPVMDLLAQRMLFDAVLALVWRALGRYGFSDADRKDLAQDVAIAAFRRHLSYRAERGSPRQWLSGILRREVKRFLRMQNRQPWFAAGDELPDTPDATETPEDQVSRRDLAEHVFAMLPAEERRVVILVELDHLTLREVAERERIAPSTAYERHQRGMAALREAAARSQEHGLHAVLPIPLAMAMFGAAGGSGPPPELAERAWQRAVVELGLADPPPAEISSYPAEPFRRRRRRPPERPASRHGGWPTPPKLSAMGAVGLAGLIGGLMLGRCSVDRGATAMQVERPAMGCARGRADPDRRRAPGSRPAIAPPWRSPPRSPVGLRSPRRRCPKPRGDEQPLAHQGPAYSDALDAERALVRRGRHALVAGNVAGALDAFEEHALEFPGGQSVADREKLWSEACSYLRRERGDRDVDDAALQGKALKRAGSDGGPESPANPRFRWERTAQIRAA